MQIEGAGRLFLWSGTSLASLYKEIYFIERINTYIPLLLNDWRITLYSTTPNTRSSYFSGVKESLQGGFDEQVIFYVKRQTLPCSHSLRFYVLGYWNLTLFVILVNSLNTRQWVELKLQIYLKRDWNITS